MMGNSVCFSPISVSWTPAEVERHTIFLRLVMALVSRAWNRGKFGGTRSSCHGEERDVEGYAGHNIGALAVDKQGEIIGWDMNQNHFKGSLIEHAEARLLGRLFQLKRPGAYGSRLAGVSLYTNLEPCFACSGLLTMSRLREVIFLQQDPDAHSIVNLMYRLRQGSRFTAPLPVSGQSLGYEVAEELEEAYLEFSTQQATRRGKPMEIAGGERIFSSAPTSFLCSDRALVIYEQVRSGIESAAAGSLRYPKFRPLPEAASNAECLGSAKEILMREPSELRGGWCVGEIG